MSLIFSPLASVYGWAGGARAEAFRRGWVRARHLRHPVISVGNLTLGGAGKTPLVLLIARLLLKQGIRPALLTRGYGRTAGPSLIALDPGAARSPDPRIVGDEPALLAAALPEVPIIISKDRGKAGRFAEERFQVDVMLLDDGFQHLRLARDIDIVALDVTQKLCDRAVLPAGRQRERVAALGRAHIAVITRTGQADSSMLEMQIRQHNPNARIFHAATRLRGWAVVRTGRPLPADHVAGMRVWAFCAIGNPEAFFRDLDSWGCELAGTRAFRDHHRYTDSDIAHLLLSAHKADATLVTTEKDVMNLPGDWKPDLDALVCLAETEILEGNNFEEILMGMINAYGAPPGSPAKA
ncbi:MAG: tetraacyldisaccharide 4'-kinase [Acidobacteriota bacterium]|nr:tetraacyldisaccharide 4'-kinase [Acidobacteriota bacterium]